METSTSRKIWSIIGLIISVIMISPVNNAIDNMHGHTTRAAIYLCIFIIGMMMSWMSVMSPVYKAPTAKEQKQALIEVRKQEEKGDKSTFWIGIMLLGVALFFAIIASKYTFSSFFNIFLWFAMVVCAIVLIVTSRPKKQEAK